MHILFLTDNFPPEGNAPAIRTFEHAKEWVKKDTKVTVITCAPNFPEGRIYSGYKNNWLKKEIIDGINIWRVKTYITANEGIFKRTLDYMSFMASSFFFSMFIRKVDVVIGTSPQFFTVLSAWAIAKIKGVKFIFELRDIWPASIEAVGAMKNNFIMNLLRKIEIFLYRQADLIISVTYSFRKDLIDRGIEESKIHVVYNGVDLTTFLPSNKNPKMLKKYDLGNKFIAGYVGTHGMAHGLETVIEAARILQDDDEIRILLAGGGSERSRIEKYVIQENLKNIVLIPRQSRESMPDLWSICDVALVNLKNKPLFKTVIPSKIFEAMSMGLPILISIPEGESTKIIRENKSGIIIPPEDPFKLAKAIKEMKSDVDGYHEYCRNSIAAAKNFDRMKLARQMHKLIIEII